MKASEVVDGAIARRGTRICGAMTWIVSLGLQKIDEAASEQAMLRRGRWGKVKGV